jgi:hypothetical protein
MKKFNLGVIMWLARERDSSMVELSKRFNATNNPVKEIMRARKLAVINCLSVFVIVIATIIAFMACNKGGKEPMMEIIMIGMLISCIPIIAGVAYWDETKNHIFIKALNYEVEIYPRIEELMGRGDHRYALEILLGLVKEGEKNVSIITSLEKEAEHVADLQKIADRDDIPWSSGSKSLRAKAEKARAELVMRHALLRMLHPYLSRDLGDFFPKGTAEKS